MAININIPIEDAVTDGSLNPVTSNAVFDAIALKANSADLATVATTGDYNDLDNLPVIPAAQVNADWNATSGVAEILNKPTIPSVTGFVPYTGATQDVDLGTHKLTTNDLVVNHPSGSGVGASITKGGAGEALTVVKSSGSGNAASITGGVTLIDELHLTTDLSDTYIASAATWNAKQAALVSGTNIKTVNGNSLLGSGDLVISGGGGSGIFGISNASGVYTYYATLTLAMAAATSGQTIEMFADYTTSGSEELSLTKNVNWNGNGHSWSKTTADSSNIITTSYNACNFSFKNINLNRSNGITSANCFLTSNPASGKIYLDGSIFTNTSTSMYALTMSTGTLEILNGTFIAPSGTGCIAVTGNILTNCNFYGVTGADIRGTANFCYAQGTTGNGFTASGILNNCIGVSTSGSGISGSGGFFHCIGRSTTLYGINPVSSTDVVNCTGISVSNIGLYLQSITSRNVVNNVGISSSSYGIQSVGTSYNYNCTAISTSSVAFLNSGAATKIYNANFISNWNNAGGYGVVGFGGNLPIVLLNCRFTLSNALAPYIFNSGTAYVIKMSKNTYEGGTAFNINITQGIINAEDAQGNIFL